MQQIILNEETIRFLALLTAAASIGLARYLGFSLIFPVFSWIQMSPTVRFAVSLGMSMPMVMLTYSLLEGRVPTAALWIALVFKELVVGALLGVVMGAPFWAIQGAGDTLDLYRGASQFNMTDPVNASETSFSGIMFMLIVLAFFVFSGGFQQISDFILRSQRVWPPLALMPPFEVDRLRGVIDVAFRGLYLALVVAAPLFIAMLLVDVVLVFATRGSARSFNLDDLKQILHNVMLMLVLPPFVLVFARLFNDYFRATLDSLFYAIDSLIG